MVMEREVPHDSDPAAVIRDWQRPMYALALQMLGNEEDAKDATQDIFIRVLSSLSEYQPNGSFQAWIYRLGTRVVLDRVRNEKRRQRREVVVAKDRADAHQEHSVEDQEAARLLLQEVSHLPEELRTPIVLHFYHGLNQVDAAVALDVARTTFRSRLQSALNHLRGTMSSAGFMAVIPQVEGLLSQTPLPMVPETLAHSLSTITASTVSSVTATTNTIVGGIIMTKQGIAVLAAVFVFALSVGFGLGRVPEWLQQSASVETTNATAEMDGIEGKIHALEQAVSRAQVRSETAREEVDRLRADLLAKDHELAVLTASLQDGVGQSSDVATTASSSKSASNLDTNSGLDWDSFRESYLQVIVRIVEMKEAEEKGSPIDMTMDDQALLMAFQAEVMKMSAAARKISAHPVLHPEILSELATVMYEGPYELRQDQVRELQAEARRLAEMAAAGLHPDEAMPLDVYGRRVQVTRGLQASLDSILDPDQEELIGDAFSATEFFMEGSRNRSQYGIESEEDAVTRIQTHWVNVFQLSDAQSSRFQAVAQQYGRESVALLRQYGQFSIQPDELDKKRSRSLEDEQLKVQLRFEQEVYNALNEQQQTYYRKQTVSILVFEYGTGSSNMSTMGPGF